MPILNEQMYIKRETLKSQNRTYMVKTKRYREIKNKFPEITDEVYENYLLKRRKLIVNAYTYKRNYNLENVNFLIESIESCSPYDIFDFKLKLFFYKYMIENDVDFTKR